MRRTPSSMSSSEDAVLMRAKRGSPNASPGTIATPSSSRMRVQTPAAQVTSPSKTWSTRKYR